MKTISKFNILVGNNYIRRFILLNVETNLNIYSYNLNIVNMNFYRSFGTSEYDRTDVVLDELKGRLPDDSGGVGLDNPLSLYRVTEFDRGDLFLFNKYEEGYMEEYDSKIHEKKGYIVDLYGVEVLREYGLGGFKTYDGFTINYMPWEFDVYKKEIYLMINSLIDFMDNDCVYKGIIYAILDNRRVVIGGYSFYISKNSNPDFIFNLIYKKSYESFDKYQNSPEEFTSWKIGLKKWVSRDEYGDILDKIDSVALKSNVGLGQTKNVTYVDEDGIRRNLKFISEGKIRQVEKFNTIKNVNDVFEVIKPNNYGVVTNVTAIERTTTDGRPKDEYTHEIGNYIVVVTNEIDWGFVYGKKVVVLDKSSKVELYRWIDIIINYDIVSYQDLIEGPLYHLISTYFIKNNIYSIINSLYSNGDRNKKYILRVVDNSDSSYLYDELFFLILYSIFSPYMNNCGIVLNLNYHYLIKIGFK
jgi:hypothetical protein